MLLSLLLIGMLAAPQEQAPAGAPPTHAAAVELAQSGKHQEALDAFRRIAAANARDQQARIWIGRLHARMGHHDLAEPVFRSVTFENPANVEALVGLGETLAALGRVDEALEVLERAEKAAPENAAVLAALGDAHRRAGHTTASLGYLRRAVATSPTREHRESLERTRMIHGHRVESTSFVESYTAPVADTGTADVGVNVRVTDRFRLFGRGQVQRKFSRTDQRGGLGAEWRWRPETTFTAHALVGTGNEVLPELDVNLDVGHLYEGKEWTIGARLIQFDGADVAVVSPGVTWWYDDRLTLGLRYHLSLTYFDVGLDRQEAHSASLQGAYRVHPRVWLRLGYARNVENFDYLSPDRIGDFRGDTASGGLRLDLPTLTSLMGLYEYQWRANDEAMNRFTLSFAQRF